MGAGDELRPDDAAAEATSASASDDALAGDADLDQLEHDIADIAADAEHIAEHAADADADAEVDVEALLSERDLFKDHALRLQADFENYRKRAAAQVTDEVDRATGRLAEALLPVLDAAEAAYLRHPDEVGPLLNAMLTELKKHGLEALDLEGQAFDPNLAEAVAHDAGDGGEVLVAEVLRSGYRWKGRTLRAAMVRTRD